MAERYWAYIHDADGDLVEDLGEFNDLNPAVTAVCDKITLMVTDDMMSYTGRVVDHEAYETTVWSAGAIDPVSRPDE